MTPRSEGIPGEHLLRELAPQVLGAVMRRFRDFAAAEDAVQEALIAATVQWPRDGLPDNPRAWLIQVASRRMTDHVRSEVARQRRETAAAMEMDQLVPPVDTERETNEDDTLILLFMCCHPALTSSSAIALTLRAVGGLTTAEIANAFLIPEATMAQRISRAKQTIKASGVPFRAPTSQERGQHLSSVLHVLYLIFNEGYTSSVGPHLQRLELSREAIRLTRSVHALLPNDAEVAGLLALLLLTDARSAARVGSDQQLVPLTKQDRTLWDQPKIAEGIALITAALSKGSVGPYQLQAAVAAVHDEARRPEDTDWPQILALYELLRRMSDNPMVILNHAIAAAMVHGPAKGLELLKPGWELRPFLRVRFRLFRCPAINKKLSEPQPRHHEKETSDLQFAQVGHACLHHVQVHFDEIIPHTARFRRRKNLGPIKTPLSHRHDFLGLRRPPLDVHGNEAPRILGEILRSVVALADCRYLELELDQLRIEKGEQQIIGPLAINHCELEVFIVKSLLDACFGRLFTHFVVFVGRSLHIIQRRFLGPIERRHEHLRQADVFRPGNSALLVAPEFLNAEVRADAVNTCVAEYSPQLASFVF
jgi:RNA polymerase sigma factor (sigma-70 family)